MGLKYSVQAQRAKAVMDEMAEDLTVYDFSPAQATTVLCSDCSVFIIHDSFHRTWKDPESGDEWVFVFVEHYPSMFFHKEDLDFWTTYTKGD